MRTDGHDEANSLFAILRTCLKTAIIMLQMLGAAVQKILARTTRRKGLLYP
jgi:hypothetical protein